MAVNLGVRALLAWVNSLKLADEIPSIADLWDGTVLLKVVHTLKKESDPLESGSTEDRFKIIAAFVEGDCRFCEADGATLSWKDLRSGTNLTTEIAKVLLLLVYHDMMNERRTLNAIDCDVEREIANLTSCYVMESDGCVSLGRGIDAYLKRRYLNLSHPVSEDCATTSPSTVSSALSVSSLSDNESPVFHRSQKVHFVDVETVASSLVSSRSPLHDIMNTPKFQMRKMQRQMIKERDYRDGLERELAAKMALITQRETLIANLQYRLDKLQEDQGDREQFAKEQLNQLENKNNNLQMRFEEMIKQNKDLKSNSSFLEHKMDELNEENGRLEAKMREVCSKLSFFEAEVGRLTENHGSAQVEWSSKMEHLQSELNQATEVKELLTEQIQILQSKISCLEDEVSKAANEDIGENMWPAIEREMLADEIKRLKNELECALASLRTAENEIEAKAQMLVQYQQEMARQKDLLEQQMSESEDRLQAKEEIVAGLQQELIEQEALCKQIKESQEEIIALKETIQSKEDELVRLREESAEHSQLLQAEINLLTGIMKSISDSLQKAEEQVQSQEELLQGAHREIAEQRELQKNSQEVLQKLQEDLHATEEMCGAKVELLTKTLQEKTEQVEILQKQIHSCEEEIQGLKQSQTDKENVLVATEERLQSVETELSAVNALVANKDQALNSLREEVTTQASLLDRAKDDAKASEGKLTELQEESCRNMEALQCEIQDLKREAEIISGKLQAKEEVFLKGQQESVEQINLLQQQLQSTNTELDKHKEAEQLAIREKEEVQRQQVSSLKEIEALIQEKEVLTGRTLLAEQKEKALDKQIEAVVLENEKLTQAKQNVEKEHMASCKMELMLQQEVASLKIEREKLVEEKEVQKTSLELLQKLQEDLYAKEEMSQSKVEVLTKTLQEKTEQVEILKKQINCSEEEIQGLKQSLTDKENILIATEERRQTIETELSVVNALVANKDQALNSLREEVTTQAGLLEKAKDDAKASEGKLTELQEESGRKMDALQSEIQGLKMEAEVTSGKLQAKEEVFLKSQQEAVEQMDLLQQQLQSTNAELKNELECALASLRTAENEIEAKAQTLVEYQQEMARQKDLLEQQMLESEEQLQAKEEILTGLQRELIELEALGQQIKESQEEIILLKETIQSKEDELVKLREESAEHSQSLKAEIDLLTGQMKSISDSLQKAEEQVQSQEGLLQHSQRDTAEQRELLKTSQEVLQKLQEDLHATEEMSQAEVGQLTKTLQEKTEQVEILQKQIHSCEEEIQGLKQSQTEKENVLVATEERLQSVETELSAVNALVANKDQALNSLREEVTTQAGLLEKGKDDAKASEGKLTELQEKSSRTIEALQCEIQDLKREAEIISGKLQAKEEVFLKGQQESVEQINLLQQQLQSTNTELDKHKEAEQLAIREKEEVQRQQVASLKEVEALIQEKEILTGRMLLAEQKENALDKQIEAVVLENEKLTQANLAVEREHIASCKMELMLQQEVASLKIERQKLLEEREKVELKQGLTTELQGQLSAKTEAAQHYKAQMEKAVSHYNAKKQLLQESQEELAELKNALEMKENEIKNMSMENKILYLDLDKVKSNEKNLLTRVASLEAQLAFADQSLRDLSKIRANEGTISETHFHHVPSMQLGVQTRSQARRSNMSTDSLDHSSLDDSLNSTKKMLVPDEASTPLVRNSGDKGAKRQALQAESLETLYFTPINNRHSSRTSEEQNSHLESTRKIPTSSVKRRRTTQKTPGPNEEEETFYSLASARSQPNLSSTHTTRPLPIEPFETPARVSTAASEQLLSLPGYRRSTIHSHTGSTFYVGTENEPEGAGDEWMRIAELQARNKACLPHLKSSYPVESGTRQGSAFIFTDEELRMGDPSETIRRASLMPGQMGVMAGTQHHRLSLMPGQLSLKAAGSSQIRSPKGTKRTSTVSSGPQTSPEKKLKASCFPRPLTPKNKNLDCHLQPATTPANRRESTMFTIENTPKKNSYLKKGLNKLRNSTRKSPGKGLRKSPVLSITRKENMASGASLTGVGRTGRVGSIKSPQVTARGQRKSPRTTSRPTKPPGLTASARKVMSRMKV